MPVYQVPALPSEDKRWRIVNGTMRRHGYSRNALIETLHTVESSFGSLDKDSIRFVAKSLKVPLSQAYGVVTFYHYFSMKPPGRHTCTICTGTACYIKGADKVLAQTEKHLHIKVERPRRWEYLADHGALRGRMWSRSRGSDGWRSGWPDQTGQVVAQLEGVGRP